MNDSAIAYEYYFKGTRKYVHGTTIFESFCRILKKHGIHRFHVNDLKFHQELHRNGHIILEMSERPPESSPAVMTATMTLDADGRRGYLHLAENPDSDIKIRREDVTQRYIGDVQPKGDYAAQGFLQDIENFETFVTALVEFNKQAHMATLNDFTKGYEYRWAFLRNMDVDLNAVFPPQVEVEVSHLGFKGGNENLSYTLNRILFDLNGIRQSPIIGFAFLKR